MEITIPIGVCFEQEITVQTQDCAKTHGSGNLEVFATPALVAIMENSAFRTIESYIPAGFDSVGTAINISHIKASGLGEKINVIATVKSVDGKRIDFDVEAFDSKGKIGSGTHTRFIINVERFLSKI